MSASSTLRDLDADLAKLQVNQARVAVPAEADRRREAGIQRRRIESRLQDRVKDVEKTRERAQQLETRVAGMNEGKGDGTDSHRTNQTPVFGSLLRGLRGELENTLKEYAAKVARARDEERTARPKIARLRVIEEGGTDLEADEAARAAALEVEQEQQL